MNVDDIGREAGRQRKIDQEPPQTQQEFMRDGRSANSIRYQATNAVPKQFRNTYIAWKTIQYNKCAENQTIAEYARVQGLNYILLYGSFIFDSAAAFWAITLFFANIFTGKRR